MITNFLKNNIYASVVLTFLRIYLGWQWVTASYEKFTSGKFNAVGFLKGAVGNPVKHGTEVMYPHYVSFLRHFAIPNADLFSFIVQWGEMLVGIGLILGVLMQVANFFGMTMNFAYLLAGTVSSNPFLIIIAIILLMGGNNSSKFGGDRWVQPFLKKLFKREKSRENLS